jgi:hypothetical protein
LALLSCSRRSKRPITTGRSKSSTNYEPSNSGTAIAFHGAAMSHSFNERSWSGIAPTTLRRARPPRPVGCDGAMPFTVYPAADAKSA